MAGLVSPPGNPHHMTGGAETGVVEQPQQQHHAHASDADADVDDDADVPFADVGDDCVADECDRGDEYDEDEYEEDSWLAGDEDDDDPHDEEEDEGDDDAQEEEGEEEHEGDDDHNADDVMMGAVEEGTGGSQPHQATAATAATATAASAEDKPAGDGPNSSSSATTTSGSSSESGSESDDDSGDGDGDGDEDDDDDTSDDDSGGGTGSGQQDGSQDDEGGNDGEHADDNHHHDEGPSSGCDPDRSDTDSGHTGNTGHHSHGDAGNRKRCAIGSSRQQQHGQLAGGAGMTVGGDAAGTACARGAAPVRPACAQTQPTLLLPSDEPTLQQVGDALQQADDINQEEDVVGNTAVALAAGAGVAAVEQAWAQAGSLAGCMAAGTDCDEHDGMERGKLGGEQSGTGIAGCGTDQGPAVVAAPAAAATHIVSSLSGQKRSREEAGHHQAVIKHVSPPAEAVAEGVQGPQLNGCAYVFPVSDAETGSPAGKGGQGDELTQRGQRAAKLAKLRCRLFKQDVSPALSVAAGARRSSRLGAGIQPAAAAGIAAQQPNMVTTRSSAGAAAVRGTTAKNSSAAVVARPAAAAAPAQQHTNNRKMPFPRSRPDLGYSRLRQAANGPKRSHAAAAAPAAAVATGAATAGVPAEPQGSCGSSMKTPPSPHKRRKVLAVAAKGSGIVHNEPVKHEAIVNQSVQADSKTVAAAGRAMVRRKANPYVSDAISKDMQQPTRALPQPVHRGPPLATRTTRLVPARRRGRWRA